MAQPALSSGQIMLFNPCERAERVSVGIELSDVLFELLGYLIHYADQERARLERVKAVLLETFNCPLQILPTMVRNDSTSRTSDNLQATASRCMSFRLPR